MDVNVNEKVYHWSAFIIAFTCNEIEIFDANDNSIIYMICFIKEKGWRFIMIKNLKIVKLFGRFDYNIKFNDKGILIITGPNGFGKSTILRMIDDFCNGSMSDLFSKYRFKSFEIKTQNSKIKLTILSEKYKINDLLIPKRDIELFDFILEGKSFSPISKMKSEFEYNKVRMMYNRLRQDRRFTNQEVDNFLFNDEKKEKAVPEYSETVNAIKLLREEIGDVSFIQEQRLIEKKIIDEEYDMFSENQVEYHKVINEKSDNLKKMLYDIMRKHSIISSELDSTYVRRLFDENAPKINNIEKSLNSLYEKQEKLEKYGLSELKNVQIFNKLDKKKMSTFEKELRIYINDANTKYNVFSDIIDKLELYERIVNRKLKFKQMILSSANGITILSDEGVMLDLANLSSGEQEIIVLFYKLIFESDVNLLLIDEPEISLHIAWQKEILDDFKSIIKLNQNMRLIIATHSPQVISNNWDLQVDLGEQYEW